MIQRCLGRPLQPGHFTLKQLLCFHSDTSADLREQFTWLESDFPRLKWAVFLKRMYPVCLYELNHLPPGKGCHLEFLRSRPTTDYQYYTSTHTQTFKTQPEPLSHRKIKWKWNNAVHTVSFVKIELEKVWHLHVLDQYLVLEKHRGTYQPSAPA